MTKIERYEEQVKELEARRSQLLRNNQFIKSMQLNEKIKEIKSMIDELKEATTPRPLSETVTKEELKEMNIIPLMLTCHLAADFLTQVCYEIIDICEAHGLSNVNFVPELKEILKKTDSFASFLIRMSPDIQNLLLRNETFNAALLKRYLNYIETRMKHFEKERKKAV